MVQGGGRVLPPSNNLAGQIDSVVEEANIFYTLSFNPLSADHPDQYHNLSVRIREPGMTARTNSGYYDQPYYLDQPNAAARSVTAEQLKQVLRGLHGGSDAKRAQLLAGLELTERLNGAAVSSWHAGLKGKVAQEELAAVVDASSFLNPPPTEISSVAPPDLSAQRLMLSRTVDYLHTTIPKLPNFFARRTTVHYEESPEEYERAGEPGKNYQPLHVVSRTRVTMLYRNGHEVVDPMARNRERPAYRHLTVSGTFGPVLSTVISDATATGFTWSRWEQSASGPRAVYRYVIPEEKSHYEITADCCSEYAGGPVLYRKLTGYHGEITIDPTSGAILRLALEADLKPNLPVIRGDIMVEYAPTNIGGQTYLCPVRSVSISRVRTLRVLGQLGASFSTLGPFVTELNDVTFEDYHLFRAETRMLPGYSPPAADQ